MNSSHVGRKELVTLALSSRDVGAAATSAAIDMQGYDRVKFTAALGAMNGGGTFDMRVEQSPNANFTGNTNISGAAIVQVANGGNTNIAEIDVKPSQRYVKVIATPATANSVFAVIATQYRGTGGTPPTLPTGSQYVAVAP